MNFKTWFQQRRNGASKEEFYSMAAIERIPWSRLYEIPKSVGEDSDTPVDGAVALPDWPIYDYPEDPPPEPKPNPFEEKEEYTPEEQAGYDAGIPQAMFFMTGPNGLRGYHLSSHLKSALTQFRWRGLGPRGKVGLPGVRIWLVHFKPEEITGDYLSLDEMRYAND